MTLTLDGLQMSGRAAAHDHLKAQLQLPDYYGRNLDALYDLLTGFPADTEICLINQAAMLDALGSYGEILVETLQQAADENRNLTFTAQ